MGRRGKKRFTVIWCVAVMLFVFAVVLLGFLCLQKMHSAPDSQGQAEVLIEAGSEPDSSGIPETGSEPDSGGIPETGSEPDSGGASEAGSGPDSSPHLEYQTEEPEEESEEEPVQISIAELEAGTVLDTAMIAGAVEDFFAAYDIMEGDAVYGRIYGKSYQDNPDIALSQLRYLKMLHYNFEHEIQVGEMIVNASLSEEVLQIFRELFEAEYEIQSMYLIDNYWTGDASATDTASIEVNNTSCFNYRAVTGGSSLSNHALGRAIDINPQQNPYIWFVDGAMRWEHENASPYIDRDSGNAHMITEGDVCYTIFLNHGFSWGGNWSNPIDYQHFEKKS